MSLLREQLLLGKGQGEQIKPVGIPLLDDVHQSLLVLSQPGGQGLIVHCHRHLRLWRQRHHLAPDDRRSFKGECIGR